MNLVEFSTRRRVTVAMVTFTFVLFGFIALGNLKVNLLPDLSYPTLTVRTEYTGAAPAEIRVAYWAERRRARIRLGHRHGSGRP
jgi:multidrug efflux pump subunit AcrB